MSVYTNQHQSTRLMPRLVSALSGVADVEIAVGFFGSSFSPALEAQITRAAAFARVRILLGMYFYRGMKDAEYKRAEAINNALVATGKSGAGVYIAHKEYHGKLYKFEYEERGHDTLILGSSNLSPDGLEKRLECNVELHEGDDRYQSLALYLDDLFSSDISYPFAQVDLRQKSRIVKTGRAAYSITEALFNQATSQVVGKCPIRLRPDDQPNSSLNLYFDGGRKSATTKLYAPRPWYEVEITTLASERKNSFYPKTVPNPTAKTPGGKSRTASFYGYFKFRGEYHKVPMKVSGDGGKDIMSAKPAGREVLGEFIKGTLEDLNVLKRGDRVTDATLQQAGFSHLVMTKLIGGDYLLTLEDLTSVDRVQYEFDQ